METGRRRPSSSASASRRSTTGSSSTASITPRFQEDELEALELDRLREVMVEASLAGPCPIVRLDPAGESHEEESPQLRLRPEATRHLEAVEPGQTDVEDRDVGAQAARRVDGGRAIVRDVRLVPLERQELGERESGLDVVVDNEDPPWRRRRARRSLRGHRSGGVVGRAREA